MLPVAAVMLATPSELVPLNILPVELSVLPEPAALTQGSVPATTSAADQEPAAKSSEASPEAESVDSTEGAAYSEASPEAAKADQTSQQETPAEKNVDQRSLDTPAEASEASPEAGTADNTEVADVSETSPEASKADQATQEEAESMAAYLAAPTLVQPPANLLPLDDGQTVEL